MQRVKAIFSIYILSILHVFFILKTIVSSLRPGGFVYFVLVNGFFIEFISSLCYIRSNDRSCRGSCYL